MTSVTETPELPVEAPAQLTVAPTEAVRLALGETGYTWLRRIDVSAEGACVVLRGGVPSFYLKQLAQKTVLAVAGVKVLRNELQVEGGNR
jgi:osmotically-inducible protein OsmY